jgi:hypothetical protein
MLLRLGSEQLHSRSWQYLQGSAKSSRQAKAGFDRFTYLDVLGVTNGETAPAAPTLERAAVSSPQDAEHLI